MKARLTVIRYFAGHPTAANLLMAIFLFLGLTALPGLQRETFPDFASTEVEITALYPGATAEDVEHAVCQRIEDALDGVENLLEVRSEAREGVARVVAEMREDGNGDRFIEDIRTEVEAIDDFPDQVEAPVIRQLARTDLVCNLAVAGPMTVPHLKAYCEGVKDRLQRMEAVSQVEILGFSDHQIRIEIPAVTLMQYGLSVSDVATVIGRQSVDLPGGTLTAPDGDVVIRFADERRTPREFEDLLVVSGEHGAEVRLGEIARITDRFELDEDKILLDGHRAGLLQIKKTKSEDTLRVMDAVREFLARERLEAPPTVTYAITKNVSEIVRDRLSLLTNNGLQGLVLVFLTMWLFFSFRYSFWVAMGLPVSFLGALFAMQTTGFSLNMLTMVGLLLALGLIMDDAIVLSENVAAHLAKGKTIKDSVVDGTAEVAMGVFSSYCTTMVVFLPLALLITGQIGKVMWVMPVVLILTLSVSLIEAFLILPHHLVHSLTGASKRPPNAFRRAFDAGLETAREKVLGRAVDWSVRWRYLSVGLVIALFLISIGMIAGGRLKARAFPEIDGDVIEARVLLPQGTPLARTEAVVRQLTEALDRVGAGLAHEQPVDENGTPMPLVKQVVVQFNTNADAGESGPHVATVIADLLAAETRGSTIDDISALWREEVGTVTDVVSLAFKEPVIGPGGLAIDIRLMGSDLHRLKAASLDLMHWLNRFDGVLDLHDDLRPGKPEMRVRLTPGALTLGLDAASVASQLRSAFHGATAAEIQVGTESMDIDVRLAETDRNSLADLDRFRVTAPGGEQVPLGAVAHLEPDRGWARIARVNTRRTVTIQGDVDGHRANAGELIGLAKKEFLPELTRRYPDVTFALEGQAKESAKTGASMRKALLFGVFGIFILLSFQFRSYYEPLVVMSAIPLAGIGVIWGHLALGLELSMPSIMGFVSLAGVVVNDSILLVEFVRMRMAEGQSPPEAARTASRQRFRAVLLTSLTTIAGLLPLLAERSLQAQVLIPLATSLVFGLAASTFLVLVVLPALYAILADFGLARIPDPEED